jgi:hypothetical protein
MGVASGRSLWWAVVRNDSPRRPGAKRHRDVIDLLYGRQNKDRLEPNRLPAYFQTDRKE